MRSKEDEALKDMRAKMQGMRGQQSTSRARKYRFVSHSPLPPFLFLSVNTLSKTKKTEKEQESLLPTRKRFFSPPSLQKIRFLIFFYPAGRNIHQKRRKYLRFPFLFSLFLLFYLSLTSFYRGDSACRRFYGRGTVAKDEN